MNTKDPKLWAFLFPAILFAGLLVWAGLPALTGQEVLLATRGVDPPDPLRGDYVALAYPVGTLWPAWGLATGDTVHVVLAPGPGREPTTDAPYWDAVRWGTDRPHLEGGEVCLKGRVASQRDDRAEVRYGIESYFIPKDETLEDWQGKEVSVLVKARGCTARIVEIHLDGTPWAP